MLDKYEFDSRAAMWRYIWSDGCLSFAPMLVLGLVFLDILIHGTISLDVTALLARVVLAIGAGVAWGWLMWKFMRRYH
jgi:hypothetical protein